MPRFLAEHEPAARLVFLALDGALLAREHRLKLRAHEPDHDEWTEGLTAMRIVMRGDIQARIVLGGRVEGYMGAMPGIAEEACLSLEADQPVFLLGGFGGCARDIAETLGLAERWAGSRDEWAGRDRFRQVLAGRPPQRTFPRRERRVGPARPTSRRRSPSSRGVCAESLAMEVAAEITMHKVFISYHHRNDQGYKKALVEFGEKYSVFVDRSVDTGDIPEQWTDEQILSFLARPRGRLPTVDGLDGILETSGSPCPAQLLVTPGFL